MSGTGTIFTLDLAARCGYAVGRVGGEVRSGAVRLKEPDETGAIAFSNLICFLHNEWSAARPALMVKEAPLHIAAFGKRKNSNATVRFTLGLHGVAEAMAMRFGVRWEEVPAPTVRKHFIGRGDGQREEIKAAVVARCKTLGYLPRTSNDDDRADALAIFDYAAATFAGNRALRLVLFGERACA